MPTEIERKFLVKNNEWLGMCTNVENMQRIRQAFLITSPSLSIRARIESSVHYEPAVDCMVTVKTGEGPIREELHFPISIEAAEAAMKFFPYVEKQRTKYEAGHGLQWEIDQFIEPFNTPTIAEIELPSLDFEIDLPDWIGEEVTWNADYYNCNIAARGFNEEADPKVEETYASFWKQLIQRPDGSVDLTQVKKELCDYSFMIDNTTKAFSELSGGMISKPNTYWYEVVGENNRKLEKDLEMYKDDLYDIVKDMDDPEEIKEHIRKY